MITGPRSHSSQSTKNTYVNSLTPEPVFSGHPETPSILAPPLQI